MDLRFQTAIYNSAPAVVIYSGRDHVEGVLVFEIVDDKITNLYAMRNPDKLAGITIRREISRA
jgi:RNA polymerase sigma-70 factor (ECF subfamily)